MRNENDLGIMCCVFHICSAPKCDDEVVWAPGYKALGARHWIPQQAQMLQAVHLHGDLLRQL